MSLRLPCNNPLLQGRIRVVTKYNCWKQFNVSYDFLITTTKMYDIKFLLNIFNGYPSVLGMMAPRNKAVCETRQGLTESSVQYWAVSGSSARPTRILNTSPMSALRFTCKTTTRLKQSETFNIQQAELVKYFHLTLPHLLIFICSSLSTNTTLLFLWTVVTRSTALLRYPKKYLLPPST